MKFMKLALLGTAALAAVSVSARADDLADLKAQIEALDARLAAAEARTSVPAGFSLLTISEAPAIVVPGLDFDRVREKSATATTIGILPTADVPASTIIQWSGSVRAALTYEDNEANDSETDLEESGDYPEGDFSHIKARGRLDVTGTTDTAVGEVGASMSLYGDFDGGGSATVKMDYAWGWWKMTPELSFEGGYAGSLGSIGYGMAKIGDQYISRGGTHVSTGDYTQFRLRYASGPLGMAIAVEHTDEDDNPGPSDGSPFGVAGEFTYAGDMFSAEIAGFFRDTGSIDQSQIGAGVGFNLSDMFNVSFAGSFGSDVAHDDAEGDNNFGDGYEFSGAIVASLSDTISAEMGAGMSEYDNCTSGSCDDTEVTAVAGGFYWVPASQLKIGVQASWQNRKDGYDNMDQTKAALVSWWNF